ncbi:hypothetical protein AS589_09465 [Empedobacter brevis]|uniref:hypothetical protein n=1 Tax=Empedobacter brevis TaxID=247 RepID=UPI0013204B82|nr:hypothetical protein [Empedobacter brevis]QHC84983.1 hypothetical protein AS589_09465 [Empedobacter brevis]
MAKQIELPLEQALAELLKFRKEIQNLSEDFVKAAAEAMNSSKNFHAAFTNMKFDEVVRKNAEANEKMRESTEKLSKATEGYNRKQIEVIKFSSQTRKTWEDYIGTLDNNIKANERLKNELEFVRSEMKKSYSSKVEFIKEEFKLKQAISDNNIIIRQQVKELQAAEGSSTRFSIKLGLMKKAYRELNQEDKLSEFGINFKAEIDDFDAQMKRADASIGNFQRNVGNYSSSFVDSFGNMRNAWVNLFSGDITGAIDSFVNGLEQIKEVASAEPLTKMAEGADILNTSTNKTAKSGLAALTSGLKSATAQAIAFIATPLGAAIAVLAGLAIATKLIWDYNDSIKENLVLIKQLTKETGNSADRIRQKIQSITDTYNKDFKQTLEEVIELSRDFDLSYNDAISIYNEGLAKGGALNKEFGDSIKEYGILFSQSGYNAREFISIINTGFNLGIYTDKLPDAIKEAGISLNEQTKSTRDALVNAFGESFSKDILSRIDSGKISIKEALEEISIQAEKSKLTNQQWGQLTADVFKGAGEDAGGAKLVFQAVYQSIQDLNAPMTEIQLKNEELRQSYEDLEVALDRAFKSDSLMEFSVDLEILWNKIKTGSVEAFDLMARVAVNGTTQISAGVRTLNDYLYNVEQTLYKLGNVDFSNLKESWNNFKNALLDFNWSDTYEKYAGSSSALGQYNSALKGSIQSLNDIAVAASVSAGKILEAEKKKQDAILKAEKDAENKKKNLKDKTARAAASAEKARITAAEKAAKEAYQEELALMQANLESYKLHNISKLESGKAFSKAAMQIEVERLEEILAQQEQIAIKESKLDYDKLQRKVANGQNLTSIEQKLLTKIYELNNNHSKSLIDLQKSYDELGLKEKEDILKLDLLSKIANGEDKEKAERWYNDAVYELRKQNFKESTKLNEEDVLSKFYNLQKLSDIEYQYVRYVLENRKELYDRNIEYSKLIKEQKQKEQEEDFERYNNGLNYLSYVLGAEAEMRTALDSYKSLLNIKELNDDQKTSEAKLQLAANVAGAMAAIAGQESAFGQAMALTQAGINIALGITKAISSKGLAGVLEGIAIAAAGAIQIGKIAGAKQPKPPQFTAPKFAKGITNSGYEGPAIVDEIGAEIHLDKKGNIKSMGENKGPRLTQVKKGDTIIPSRFSEKIKAMMQTRYMPDAPTMNTLLLGFPIGNTPAKNDYDFQRLEKKMDKLIKVSSMKKDKNYLLDDGKIIEVTTKANGTHQRYIDKIDSEPKNRPSRLN